jgi:hypothetical protein
MEADSFKSPPFPQLLNDFLRPATPDAVALGVIQGAGDENLRASAFAPLIHSDTRYRNYLFAQTFLADRMSEWFEENAKNADRESVALDRTLGLLGKEPIRNLMACAHIDKILGTLDLSSVADPEKKISSRPSESIPFALEAEKTCMDKNWIFPETAFAAGIHYDWLSAIVKKKGGTPEDKSAIGGAFAEGVLTAKMAYVLGERTQEIKSGKYLFSAGILLPLGKAMMACLYPKSASPSWSSFTADVEKAAEKRFDFLYFLERRKFPVSHAELGSLFVNFGAVLRVIEKAIYYYQEPDALQSIDPNLHQLSIMISLANRMALAKGAPFPLEPFHVRWMKTNRISEESLKNASNDALKSK